MSKKDEESRKNFLDRMASQVYQPKLTPTEEEERKKRLEKIEVFKQREIKHTN